MLIVLIIIAILLFLILIAIEPEMLQIMGSLLGIIFGLAVIAVGGIILWAFLSDKSASPQSDVAEPASISAPPREDDPIILESDAANTNESGGPWEGYRQRARGTNGSSAKRTHASDEPDEELGEEVTDPELLRILNARSELNDSTMNERDRATKDAVEAAQEAIRAARER